jgi:transposase
LPILGKSVNLHIAQKKYFCDNDECETDIFTERTDFIEPGSQFTARCREYMLKVATLASCEAAVKILAFQGIRVSGDTLLNMLKAAGKEYISKAGTKIGVDDWAYRRGQSYGTIICDLETHDIIEVLESRDGKVLENWLMGHPGIEVVSRDRASSYSSAVSNVLPAAVQIADRFHITKNLLDALNDTMKGFLPEVIEVPITETIQPELKESSHMLKKTRRRSNPKASVHTSKTAR